MRKLSEFGGEPGENYFIYPLSRRTPELSDILSYLLLLCSLECSALDS